MNVEDIDRLHRRYVELSHQFRAGWVYHQFLQSLAKVFDMSTGQWADSFQKVYSGLKEVSSGLTASEAAQAAERLEDLERRLGDLTEAMVGEDSKVSPEHLRQFFHRFQKYDEKILVQLSRFYVYAGRREGWSADRVDKLDFLLTRIGEEESEASGGNRRYRLAEGQQLTEIYASLGTLAGTEALEEREIERHRRRAEEIRAELGAVGDLDELNQRGLLSRFREFKHGLGAVLLEPRVLAAVLETNLAFKNLVRRFYRQEERRIVAEYQQIFELEKEVPLDVELEEELQEFRQEIEAFEERLQREEFRLGDLARIRGRVHTLMPRLRRALHPEAEYEDYPAPETPGVEVSEDGADTREVLLGGDAGAAAILGEDYRELFELLGQCDPELSPKATTLRPDVYPLRLEPREVVAFRRLQETDEEDPAERFLLEAAALRVRINRQAEEIRDHLDDTYQDPNGVAQVGVRASLKLADRYLWLFHHRLHELVVGGWGEEARQMELLRMRLMRDYSGLWLLAYKPQYGSTR